MKVWYVLESENTPHTWITAFTRDEVKAHLHRLQAEGHNMDMVLILRAGDTAKVLTAADFVGGGAERG